MVKEIIAEIIDDICKKEAVEEDYIGEDGLLYCGRCRTKKQTKIKVAFMDNEEKIFPCICNCDAQQLELHKNQLKQEEQNREIQKLRLGIQNEYRQWTFEADNGNPRMDVARRYVEQWETAQRENIGLLLWGNVGTGKTYIAACIANALIDKGIAVLMTNIPAILSSLSGLHAEEKNAFIRNLNYYPLLIIDDLGVERTTSYAMEQIYQVIDSRYTLGWPLIVTTNLTLEELQLTQEVEKERIYSRILEMCTPIHVEGPDRRREKAAHKVEMAKKILN